MYLWKKAPASCTIWTSLSPRLQSKLLPHSTRTEELGCLNSLGASWPLRSASTAANGFSERSSGEKDPCQTCSSTVGLHCRLEPDCNREATLLRANMHCQQHPCHCWQRAIFHAGNSSHPREKHSLSAAQICCVWAVLNHHFRQRSVTVSTGTCTTSTGNDTWEAAFKAAKRMRPGCSRRIRRHGTHIPKPAYLCSITDCNTARIGETQNPC